METRAEIVAKREAAAQAEAQVEAQAQADAQAGVQARPGVTFAGEPDGCAVSTISGFLADLLKAGGARKRANPIDLVSIAFGAELMNQGVLLEGLRVWKRVSKWGAAEIALARKVVEPVMLTNAMAEQFYGAFGKSEGHKLPDLAAGAILGENAARVSSFYEEETVFMTRVVGLKYEDRMEVAEDLVPGEQLFLVWEQENPYDSKALAVVTTKGHRLGYIRRSIARKLVARMKAGADLLARVRLVLENPYDINERVWIQVRVAPKSGLPVPKLEDDEFDLSAEA